MKLHRNNIFMFLWALAAVSIDQVTKFWAIEHGWVVYNRGFSFGFLSGASPILMLTIVTCVLGAIWWMLRSRQLPAWWWGVLIGGTMSNLLDRIVYDGVQDWLPLPCVSLTNNLADWAICFCLVWLCIKEYRTIRS